MLLPSSVQESAYTTTNFTVTTHYMHFTGVGKQAGSTQHMEHLLHPAYQDCSTK